MRILDRLPIYREHSIISAQGEPVQVWKNQIIVWLSIQDPARPFPAILDTGHSSNLSIAKRHLDRWTAANLKQIGSSKIGKYTAPQYEASVFIHRNTPGTHAIRGAFRLELEGGIAVIADDSPAAPRLPLFGLRAVLDNDLKLMIDGSRKEVTLRSS
jgi:hypothetical protein